MTEKKRFVVVPVVLTSKRPASLERFAQQLEDGLNKCINDGYSTTVEYVDGGAVVIGHLESRAGEVQTLSISDLLRSSMAEASPEFRGTEVLTPETNDFILGMLQKIKPSKDREEVRKTLLPLVAKTIRSMPSGQVRDIKDNLETYLEEHKKHCSGGDCQITIIGQTAVEGIQTFLNESVC